MIKALEAGVCGVDGCGPAADDRKGTTIATGISPDVEIEVVSDAICPWCYIAKRNLDKAVAELRTDLSVDVKWLPFELNAGMPKGGLDRKAYRSAKFGSWEHSQRLDAQVAKAGKDAGIEFRHDRMERTPNTFDAHRLVWWAERNGVQGALVEGLFGGYFTGGRDVGDRDVLAQIAAEAGFDPKQVRSFLDSDEGSEEVKLLAAGSNARGFSGVPTILVNGNALFSGARSTEIMLAAIRQLVDPAPSAGLAGVASKAGSR
jgi:predicted DsbA family dithiol-disulfide isomerase